MKRLLTAVANWILKLTAPSEALVTAPNLARGLWERHINQDDALLGWKYNCACGWSCKRPSNELERNKVHECPNCHVRFNLNQSLVLNGSRTEIIKSDKTPTRTMQAVGDEPVKDTWSGMQVRGRDKSYETGDPGWMGPGF